MSEDLGEVTSWSNLGLSPKKGDTLQLHSIIIHDFEIAYCDSIGLSGDFVVTHVIQSCGSDKN